MKVLSIDTSTNTGSVAIVDDNKLLAEVNYDSKSSHAEILLQKIESTLKKSGLKLDDMEGFAVTIGPGSFTGLRIGLATAKGLAVSLGKPLVGISTLKALSTSVIAGKAKQYPIACLNAYRDEVYANESVMSPKVLAEQLSKVEGEVVFVGDGAEKYSDIFKEKLGKQFKIVKPKYTLAASAAFLAVPLIKEGHASDLANLSPNYIRKSAAEEKTPDHMTRGF